MCVLEIIQLIKSVPTYQHKSVKVFHPLDIVFIKKSYHCMIKDLRKRFLFNNKDLGI